MMRFTMYALSALLISTSMLLLMNTISGSSVASLVATHAFDVADETPAASMKTHVYKIQGGGDAIELSEKILTGMRGVIGVSVDEDKSTLTVNVRGKSFCTWSATHILGIHGIEAELLDDTEPVETDIEHDAESIPRAVCPFSGEDKLTRDMKMI